MTEQALYMHSYGEQWKVTFREVFSFSSSTIPLSSFTTAAFSFMDMSSCF